MGMLSRAQLTLAPPKTLHDKATPWLVIRYKVGQRPANPNLPSCPQQPIKKTCVLDGSVFSKMEVLVAVAASAWSFVSNGTNVPFLSNYWGPPAPYSRAEDVEALVQRLSAGAEVLFPGSQDYDYVTRRWSALAAPTSSFVVVVATEQDVAETVSSAQFISVESKRDSLEFKKENRSLTHSSYYYTGKIRQQRTASLPGREQRPWSHHYPGQDETWY